MAKAQFHRNQKVWVDSVGAWAVVEKIVPVWARGFDEPVKITYDVGLGRDFAASELRAEEETEAGALDADDGQWRVLRAKNKWQTPEHCVHHPYPGTFPVVVTDRRDWGGWRVPGAEYDRDPEKFERQARLITAAPGLLKLASDLIELVEDAGDRAPAGLVQLAKTASILSRRVTETPMAPQPTLEEAAPNQAA